MEVDSGKQVEYNYKLAEALTEIRAQQSEQVDIYKREMENTYMTKVCGHDHSTHCALIEQTLAR